MENLTLAVGQALSVEGGFLPAAVPPARLPGPLQIWVDICGALPAHYHGPDAHVRPWLDERLSGVAAANDLEALSEAERHTLMTVLSTLAHAYRWDSAPPRPAEYERKGIELPAALDGTWTQTASLLGMPRVGSLYHLVLHNWRLVSRPEGGAYRNDEVAGDNIELAFPYLQEPDQRGARAMFGTIIEMEARGAPALRTVTALMAAATRQSALETTWLLDRLRTEIQQISHVFSAGIRRHVLSPNTFLSLVQPTHVWGLDLGTGPLDGASGSQAPIVQALDAVLGLSHGSHTAQTLLKARRYMLPAHRRFLDFLDAEGGVVRAYVEHARDAHMTELFNDCVKGVEQWRTIHQKRGALYLKGEPGTSTQYASVSKVVTLEGDRVHLFEEAMQQRLAETTAARFTDPMEAVSGFEATFQSLTAEERRLLEAGSSARTFASGETVLAEASRAQALFVVRRGAVRVETKRLHGEATIAFLGEGELFGEMSFLENQPSSSSVVADGPCEIEVIDRAHVYELLNGVEGFAGRFFQSLATLLSRRLRRTNALVERALTRHVPPRPHPSRGGGALLPPELEKMVRAFDEATSLTAPDSMACMACDALLALLGRPDVVGNPGWLDSIYREVLPAFLASPTLQRLVSVPPGTVPEFAWWQRLRGTFEAASGVELWARALPTLRGLCEVPRAILRSVPAAERMLTLAGTGTAAWGPDLLAALGPTMALTCVDADAEALAHGTERAQALGLSDRVTLVPDDVLHLAWARGRTLPPQDLIVVDNVLSFLPDRECVAVVEWARANLRDGGRATLVSMAPSVADRPFFDHIVNWAVLRRDEDGLSDLFSRGGFGTQPVEVEAADAALLLASCIRR